MITLCCKYIQIVLIFFILSRLYFRDKQFTTDSKPFNAYCWTDVKMWRMRREFCRYLGSAGKLQIFTLYLYLVCARKKTLLRRIMTRVQKCSALNIAFQSLRFETKRCKIYTQGHFSTIFYSLKGTWSRLQTKLIFCNFNIHNAQIIHFNKQPQFE